ncbi:MAG: hypothetical protein AAF388_06790 [Bacteroidota bacterium]
MSIKGPIESIRYKMHHSAFWIRLLNWEYWPMHLVYTPVYLYYLFLSLKARAFVFFSAANPGIDMGGLLGESKYDILQKIPSAYIPKTLYLSKEMSHGEVISSLEKAAISFPLILKPDVGERGFMVEKIRDEVELADYRRTVPTTLLAQEYIHYQEEVSVLYYSFLRLLLVLERTMTTCNQNIPCVLWMSTIFSLRDKMGR